MERFWNYVYYLQWKLLNYVGKKVFQQPIERIFSVVPFFRKNFEKGREFHEEFTAGKNFGMNIGFAFTYLMMTTTIIYAIICLYINVLLDYNAIPKIKLFITGVLIASYLTNYFPLWRKDRYLKYFEEFDKKSVPKVHYLYLILFHLGVMAFGILSIHWTIGFKF